MGFGVVGLDFQRLPVMGDSLVDLSAARQSHAEVVVGRHVVGLDFNRFPVMGNSRVDLPVVRQSHAEVEVGAGEVGLGGLIAGMAYALVAPRRRRTAGLPADPFLDVPLDDIV